MKYFIDHESLWRDSGRNLFVHSISFMARQTVKTTRTKLKKNQYRGILYIQAGHHNTIVTLANVRGEVLCWSSAGACGFRGKRKATSFAAKKAAEVVAKKSRDFSMNEVKILVTGPGQGRETAIREIFKAGLKVYVIREKTGIPHNGCRPPKKRRV
jgi:small subunit ribosomal protein S11